MLSTRCTPTRPAPRTVTERYPVPLETFRTLTLLVRPTDDATLGRNHEGREFVHWRYPHAPFRLSCYLYDEAACEQVGHHRTCRAVLMYRAWSHGLPEYYLDLFPTDERAYFNLNAASKRASLPKQSVIPFVVDTPQGGILYLTPRR